MGAKEMSKRARACPYAEKVLELPSEVRRTVAARKKKSWGGKRDGAGRQPSPTVRLRVTVQRATAAILERMARAKGLCRRIGAPPFLGAAVDDLAALANTQEPEYLKIAREAQ